MKKISILGSTGSIGTQTLEVIENFPNKFKIVGLAAGRNIEVLIKQIEKFKPSVVCVFDEITLEKLSNILNSSQIEFLYGKNGYNQLAADKNTDLVVSAMVGFSGLEPTISAIRAGNDIALANKEALVVGGEIIVNESIKYRTNILPIDSEHNAIFQVIQGNDSKYIKSLIITASGGPFRNLPVDEFENITVENALNHPTWKMGDKITIDSSTLMNKGFEVIEAKWLFKLPLDKISVIIHPQSIVHSMVEFVDGSIISQLSSPNMKIPISYALSYPDRLPMNNINSVSFNKNELTFEEVDNDKFPSINLAKNALNEGGTMPCVLNAANEIAVKAFLAKKIKFTEILNIINEVMQLHENKKCDSIETLIETDNWARNRSESLIN